MLQQLEHTPAMGGLVEALARAGTRVDDAPGYAPRTITHILDLDGKGRVTGFGPAAEGRKGGVRMSVPDLARSSSKAPAALVVDRPDYVLGWTRGGDPDRAATLHDYYRDRITEWVAAAPSPEGRALQAFLARPDRPAEPDISDQDKAPLVAVRVDGRWVHDTPAARRWWAGRVHADKLSDRDGTCLVCGETGRLWRVLPFGAPIHLLPDAGARIALTAVNNAAQGYDGVRQLEHTPICEPCGVAACTGLVDVLTHSSHSLPGQRAKVAVWADTRDADTRDRVHQVARTAMSGTAAEFAALTATPVDGVDPLTPVHVLVAAAATARLMPLAWETTTLGGLWDNLRRWRDDCAVLKGTGELVSGSVARAAQGFGPLVADSDSPFHVPFGDRDGRPDTVWEGLARVVLLGRPVPPDMAGQVLRGVRQAGTVTTSQAGVLAAYLRRAPDPVAVSVPTPGLDPTGVRLHDGLDDDPLCRVARAVRVSRQAVRHAAAICPGEATLRVEGCPGLADVLTNPTTAFVTMLGGKAHSRALAVLGGRGRRYEALIAGLLDGVHGTPRGVDQRRAVAAVLAWHHQDTAFSH